jgi:hypothetical protein
MASGPGRCPPSLQARIPAGGEVRNRLESLWRLAVGDAVRDDGRA